ncbi:MAG: hypothetical protein IPF92_14640 [Myxococcales bacterium]|jgi:hypothetical protein|nr:hypothetical protein [Myxococcales bacterium]MBL0195114.1 hypothetical protein [Myxococcales bacterium]HQY61169.1 hypothetical protein [Polyangiaceae bacterium]
MDAKSGYRAVVYLEGLGGSGKARRLAIWFHGLAFCFGIGVAGRCLRPLAFAKRPVPIPGDTADGHRFGLSLADRKAIFAEIAAAEPEQRSQAKAAFPGQEWSQEDHRCAFERDSVRSIAARRSLSLTQVYLVLDEGIRDHWPDPQGKPLTPTTVPVVPRRM